ncbi:acyl-CoA dehydrogenase family protein [Rhizomonospora bruguierae]|uniref:acyl-CoA dehydrogenase family protein n=1 Tax=Rhizomonospora bruguierae TaxID=1581705 RepID=UPI001BD1AB36|nr:acyl-CoA dehydrogenase family protein [Micromonospora sp. NBRC 107566]
MRPEELTAEQRAVLNLCREFGRKRIRPVARAVDEADVRTPWELWRAAAEVGITGSSPLWTRPCGRAPWMVAELRWRGCWRGTGAGRRSPWANRWTWW